MRTALALLLLLLPALADAQVPTLRLDAPAGSTDPIESAVTIDSPQSGATEWFAKSDQPWLTVEPRTGITPTRVIIRANPSGLPPGTVRATLRFVDDAGDPMLVVPVSLTVGTTAPEQATVAPTKAGQTAKPAPAALSATAQASAARPPVAPLAIAIDTLPPVTRNMPYSQAIPVKGGKPPYAIRVVDGRLPMGIVLNNGALTGLTKFPGTFPILVSATDSSTPPQTVTKPLVLRAIIILQGTALRVSAPSLTLFAQAGVRAPGTRVGVESGTQALAWLVSGDQAWIRVTPNQGMAPGVFQVDVDATGLEPGSYVGTITVTMDGAPNSPMRIPVQVTIK